MNCVPANPLHLPYHRNIHFNVILWLGGEHLHGGGCLCLARPGQGHGVPQQRGELGGGRHGGGGVAAL